MKGYEPIRGDLIWHNNGPALVTQVFDGGEVLLSNGDGQISQIKFDDLTPVFVINNRAESGVANFSALMKKPRT